MRGSVVSNGLLNALASLVAAVSGVITSVLVVSQLSAAEFGRYGYFLWLGNGILLVLGTLAFPNSLTKIAAELRGRGESVQAGAVARLITLGSVAFNLLIGLVVTTVALLSEGQTRLLLLLVAFNPLFGAVAALLSSVHWSHQRFLYPSLANICGSLAQVTLVVLAARLDWGLPGFLAAVVALNFTQMLVLLWPFLGRASSLLPLRTPEARVLKYFWLFFLPTTLLNLFDAVVWQNSGIFFLERYSALEQVGYYSLAFTTFALFLNLGRALVFGYYPAISADFGAGDWERIRQRIAQGSVLAMLYAVPVSFGGLACLEALFGLLYREKMDPAVPVAMALFAGLVPGVMAGLLTATVGAINRVWGVVWLAGAVTVGALGLSLLLAPLLGALGAALVNLTSQLLYGALMYVMVRRLTGVRFPWATLAGIAALGALSTYALPKLALAWLGGGPAGLAAAVLLGGAAYAGAVWLMGYHRVLTGSGAPEGGVRAGSR